jgi:hypothetical protein
VEDPFRDADEQSVIMVALFDIRQELRYVINSSRTKMAKRRKRTPEERAAAEARYQETIRLLSEAIERRKARIAEQRRAAGEQTAY